MSYTNYLIKRTGTVTLKTSSGVVVPFTDQIEILDEETIEVADASSAETNMEYGNQVNVEDGYNPSVIASTPRVRLYLLGSSRYTVTTPCGCGVRIPPAT